MKANRLQLNPTKTEVLWCASSRRQHLIPTESVRVGNVSESSVTAVRDLGVYIDADVSTRTHVTNIIRACFSALRQIRSVRRDLPPLALLTLVRSLVITKLDRCNSVLAVAGITRYLQDRLQSMINAAARLVYSRWTSEHTTALLRQLHWLRVPERIPFRLAAGMPLCARQSTGVSHYQHAADIRGCCSSSSALCRLSDDAGAVNPSINSR